MGAKTPDAPKGAGAKLALSPACARLIEKPFRSREAMYKRLGTNAVTWKQVTRGDGAKTGTVKAIAVDFMQMMHDLNLAGFPTTDPDVFPLIARAIHTAHGSLLESGDWERLIVLPDRTADR